METFTRRDLQALMEPRDGWCVSIYMPTQRKGADQQQNPVRLKNLIREAQRLLSGSEVEVSQAKGLLAPARELLAQHDFWQHQSDGLAVFLTADLFRNYRLPVPFEEKVVAARRFDVRPLLPLLATDGRFYVLAIAKESVRLLRGSRFSIDEVRVEGMPATIEEALNEEVPGSQLQFRVEAPQRSGKRAVTFYGHGGEDDYEKDKLLRFFRTVDHTLHSFLADKRAPLVLAGVGYLHPIYRKANTYPHLAADGIDESPRTLGEQQLHDRAWAVVEPFFLEVQRQALARYRQLAGTGHTASSVEQIVPLAYQGGVECLLVAQDARQWGTYDPTAHHTRLHEQERPGDDDLLSFAALHTLLHKGAVYVLLQEAIPDSAQAAAVLRAGHER